MNIYHEDEPTFDIDLSRNGTAGGNYKFIAARNWCDNLALQLAPRFEQSDYCAAMFSLQILQYLPQATRKACLIQSVHDRLDADNKARWHQ